jgi:tRNA(fMet)-specific endonuclease VapC
MARFLLDTSIVSAPLAKVPDTTIVNRFELQGHDCVIAAPVWHELLYGCQRLPRGSKRLESKGRPMPYVDGQIAAIAAVNDLTLVTRNTKDFAPYKDIRIEDWSSKNTRK